jgi:hypothetical protein
MLTLKMLFSSFLILAIMAVPAIAGSNEAKTANEEAANSATAAATAAEPTPAGAPSPSLTSTAGDANVTALLGVLVMKGVLAPSEANAIRNAAPEAEFHLLVEALSRKGILSAADLAAAAKPASQPAAPATASAAVVETATASNSSALPSSPPQGVAQQPAPGPQTPVPPPAPAVVAAIAPLRVLPVDPPKKDGLNAAFKMGPVKMTPYGFIKSTAAHDTSSPNGDDFPFVGLFLTAGAADTLSTGPTQDPEFHIKARSTRIGANFEWPDASPRLTFTGRVEGDYEGNFSEVDNRDVSSIRSNAFQLRLAFARMDYAASGKTDIYFEGGQDWSLFASTALPNILETTFLGAYYGTIYERSPQFQFGLVHTLGGSRNFKISPTFALMMPSSGQILKLGSVGLAGQLGEGEREGADSGRPEVEGRLALQWQLDKAPAVAPAQIAWAGFQSRRTSIVAKENYAACAAGPLCATYEAAFPNGFTSSSTQYGNQIVVQLPTRWATLVASGYFGGDLRFFFGGQVDTYYTDTAGLSNVVAFTSTDGGPLVAAGAAALGCTGVANPLSGTCSGSVVVAPEKPIRAFGGFVNVGFPLSRWFNANPKGHNAGWQLYLHAGKDQVVKGDLTTPNAGATANTLSPLPLLMGKVFAATLYYKINPYVTFGIEQSVYGTRLAPGVNYDIAGSPDNLWQDHRTEFGPIFSF